MLKLLWEKNFGEVVINKRSMPEEKIVSPLKKDLKNYEENKVKEKEAFKICEEKIEKYNLNMHLIDVEYKFDNSKILFYFTADGRIDFRELVKDLAAIF